MKTFTIISVMLNTISLAALTFVTYNHMKEIEIDLSKIKFTAKDTFTNG